MSFVFSRLFCVIGEFRFGFVTTVDVSVSFLLLYQCLTFVMHCPLFAYNPIIHWVFTILREYSILNMYVVDSAWNDYRRATLQYILVTVFPYDPIQISLFHKFSLIFRFTNIYILSKLFMLCFSADEYRFWRDSVFYTVILFLLPSLSSSSSSVESDWRSLACLFVKFLFL